MSEEKNILKKLGRPKNPVVEDEVVDEKDQVRLEMSDKPDTEDKITIDDLTNRWKRSLNSMVGLNSGPGLTNVAAKWNKLNPFLQNERIKNLYTRAKTYGKVNIAEFLQSPGNYETQLRSLAWANSSSQQIYYNILRRSCDIPLYHYFTIPDLLEKESDYKDDSFDTEDKFVQEWLELFNIPNTFKTIALEVKREGKSSYLLRNKFNGQGKNKKPGFCALQKMPTDWVKITGKGQLGYTVSFNMLYFLNIANNPEDFGDFMVRAWNDITSTGIIVQNPETKELSFNLDKARDYEFEYNDVHYASAIELVKGKRGQIENYMFWLRMPYDMCYTFGSDNSQPWMAPDTMGLMLKLQELTDYGQLAGLIASTPLTAVLTGEIETIANARAGKNESVYTPEVLQGYMTQFNQATSTNLEAWLWPAKNIKVQQLSSDVNSSEILSEATTNFLESAGEGGLTIATDKPNVAQITVAKQLAASQQHYVTLQFENVMNYILQHKLGLNYRWKIRIWGDIFNSESEKKFLKEIVANGNIALLPKLMSAEGISVRDTKAMTSYIKTLGFYDDFMTYTQVKNAELSNADNSGDGDSDGEGQVGRPSISDDEVENDATAASKAAGTNTLDNRDKE